MLDSARQRQLEYDLHATSPRLKKYQREKRRHQLWQRNAIGKDEIPISDDDMERVALIEAEQKLVRPERSTSEKAANVIPPASSFIFSSSFVTMPETTTVLVNNIPIATTDSEIKNFFSFWFAPFAAI